MSLDGRLVNIQIALGSGSDSKETLCNVGDLDSIPGLGRSPGEGNDNQFQLPGEFHGQRSLEGYSPLDCKELDTTEKEVRSYQRYTSHPDLCYSGPDH